MAADYKEKIKKLLALASSPNENEARSALLKARQLMAEHKISELELGSAENQEIKSVLTDVTFSKRRNPWVCYLSATIATNYCCKAYRTHKKGAQTQTLGFIGFENDVEICIAVFNYALECILSEIKRIRKNLAIYDAQYVKRVIDNYGHGYVAGIACAFDKQQKENGWGLVLTVPQEVKNATMAFEHKTFQTHTYPHVPGYSEGHEEGKKFDPTKRLQPATE